MEVVYLLVPVSVVLVFGIAVAFWWSVKSGQFDDLDGAAWRILDDEDIGEPSELPRPRGDERRSA